MLQQTKMSRKDEIVLKMEEQIRIVTLCHNCHFWNMLSNARANLCSFNKNMVNHTKSNALKAQMVRKKQDDLMAQAVALFHSQKMDSDTGKPMSIQKLCQFVSNDHYARTRQRIPVSNSTLQRLVKGGCTRTESNGEKSWLTKEEGDIIVDFTIVTAHCGFPLSPSVVYINYCFLVICILFRTWNTFFFLWPFSMLD